MSNHPSRFNQLRAMWRWWQHTGERIVLMLLGIALFALPMLVFVQAIAPAAALRATVVLCWLAGGLLLARLPGLLRTERLRVALLAGVGIFAMLAALLVTMLPQPGSMASNAQAAELAGLLSAMQQEAQSAAANTAAAPAGLTFVSPPRISADMFAYVLQRGMGAGPSPAAPYAYELYNIIVSYRIDPGVALAFFAHESSLCQAGVCSIQNTKGWGGQRAAYRSSRALSYAPGPFVRYRSWNESVRDWCELILYGYVQRGLDTVEKALPVYAPQSDGNVPTAYAATVRRLVANWQGRTANVPPQRDEEPRVYKGGLENALIAETFRASGLDFHAEWAFHRYALDEARQSRSLGAPLDESRVVTVDGKQYAVQTFATDTLYTPLAADISQTVWNDVRRFSDLLKQNKATATPAPPPTATAASATTARPAATSTATTRPAASATPAR